MKLFLVVYIHLEGKPEEKCILSIGLWKKELGSGDQ